jgi:hypothetical protein
MGKLPYAKEAAIIIPIRQKIASSTVSLQNDRPMKASSVQSLTGAGMTRKQKRG